MDQSGQREANVAMTWPILDLTVLGAVEITAALTDPFRCDCAVDALSFSFRKLQYFNFSGF